MTQPGASTISTDRRTTAPTNPMASGVCLIVGAAVFATVRLLHGDTPAAHAEAALNFVASRPAYAAVHLSAVLAAFVALSGLIPFAHSLTSTSAWLLGRLGVASFMMGLAVFAVESTSEGLALPELGAAAQSAAPGDQAELVRTAHAVAAATHGPSLVGMALLFGLPLMLLGLAMVQNGYPLWLGWSGTVIGTVTLLSAAGLFLVPTLFPGAVLYGVLGSMIAQSWLLATGVVVLRRSTGPRDRA